MKILVVEDTPMHQESARETLKGHELTIVDSFPKALEELQQEHPYDVVFTDLMLPMDDKGLYAEAFRRGELVPYGFVIVLRAALYKAKYVALVTDINHHTHAMAIAMDSIAHCGYDRWGQRPRFNINGATCMFAYAPLITPEELPLGVSKYPKNWGRVLADLTKDWSCFRQEC